MKRLLNKLRGSSTVRVDADDFEAIPWSELWRFRELFAYFAWRDFLVRYKQTFIGIVWAVLEPVIRMVVLTVVFKEIAGMDDSTPVAIFAAILPWQFFRKSVNTASLCLVENRNIVSKVYFPRLVLPSSTILVNFVDFFINFAILIILMIAYGDPISWRIIAIFPLIILTALLALGIGLFIAPLYVRYRDFKMILAFAIEIGLFITPVGYQTATLDADIRDLIIYNPLTGIIDAFRWAVFGQQPPELLAIAFSMGSIVLLIYFGIRYFRRAEQWLTDII